MAKQTWGWDWEGQHNLHDKTSNTHEIIHHSPQTPKNGKSDFPVYPQYTNKSVQLFNGRYCAKRCEHPNFRGSSQNQFATCDL